MFRINPHGVILSKHVQVEEISALAPMDLQAVAANVASMLIANQVPIEMLEPMMGVIPDGSLFSCATTIADRIMKKELEPRFALIFSEQLVSQLQSQRGCRDKIGTKLLLELLLESCPKETGGKERHGRILATLESYNGPCCNQSLCVRGEQQ